MSSFHVTVEQARRFTQEAQRWEGGRGTCTCESCRLDYCCPAFGHRGSLPLVNPEEDRIAQTVYATNTRFGS